MSTDPDDAAWDRLFNVLDAMEALTVNDTAKRGRMITPDDPLATGRQHGVTGRLLRAVLSVAVPEPGRALPDAAAPHGSRPRRADPDRVPKTCRLVAGHSGDAGPATAADAIRELSAEPCGRGRCGQHTVVWAEPGSSLRVAEAERSTP